MTLYSPQSSFFNIKQNSLQSKSLLYFSHTIIAFPSSYNSALMTYTQKKII